MIVDCTTQSNIYNPLSAQGQWYKHIWGRREYPALDLDVDLICEYSKDTPVTLQSLYGDPLCWKYVEEFAKHKRHNLGIVTHANVSDVYLDKIKRNGCTLTVLLDGLDQMCGKIHLGVDWDTVQRNLEILSEQDTVIFYAFKHNCFQIPELVNFAVKNSINLEIQPGTVHNNPGISVIDSHYNWLYDVIPEDIWIKDASTQDLYELATDYQNTPETSLEKTLWGFNSLRTYMPVLRNRSINQKPMITKLPVNEITMSKLEQQYQEKSGTFVSPDGRLFENHNNYTMYMYMLGNDWIADNTTLLKTNDVNSYENNVIFYAQKFLQEEFVTLQKQ